jgi:hypothetical protein
MMSLLWKYILMHKMNAFCSDCTWMRPATLHTLCYCTLLSLSFNSHDHMHMPLLKAVQDAQTSIALLTVIQDACCFFLQGTWQCLCLPLEDECCESMTSYRLSWDEDGVGLPRDTPLTVTLALWLCITKSHTRTSQNFLCVMFPPQDLWIKKRIQYGHFCQMEKQLLGPLPCSPCNFIAVGHPVWFVHKPHIGIVLDQTGFDSTTRFILEVTLNWNGCMLVRT